MLPKVEPRPASCTTCGTTGVTPRIQVVHRNSQVITEAHWICPRCSNRFLSGIISTVSETKKN